jgi:hypothetical protein
MPSKYDSIVACLDPCLECDAKLESAQFSCINDSECNACGFRQLWSSQIRKKLLKDNDDMRNTCVLAGPEWTEGKIFWRRYTQQVSTAIGADDDDSDEYSPSESKNARNLVLETTKGSLIDFLDNYEVTSEQHAYHRNLVSTERASAIQYEHNVRPLMITRNQDFAENGSIKNKRQVQSQYWITISYTLFISCVTWLKSKEWNKEAGKLDVGDEVTVYGEKSGEPVSMNSFWATVTMVVDDGAQLYEVTDDDGTVHRPVRQDLRHRKITTLCLVMFRMISHTILMLCSILLPTR